MAQEKGYDWVKRQDLARISTSAMLSSLPQHAKLLLPPGPLLSLFHHSLCFLWIARLSSQIESLKCTAASFSASLH